MSDQATPQGEATFDSFLGATDPFAAIMDTLVPEKDGEAPAAGGAPAPADAGATGQPAAAPEGAGSAEVPAAGEPAGAAGDQGVPNPGQPAAPADQPAGPGQPAAPVAPAYTGHVYTSQQLGQLSTALEDQAVKMHQQTALEEVRAEYGKYFEALQQHPRMLVGQTVPSLRGDQSEEVLRDSTDARDWQEAVKAILTDEIRARAESAAQENAGVMQTLHNAIGIFQNNPDLVPGSKTFDRELADQFARVAKPYESRVDGKLHGYSIPVDGLIKQLREQLVASRAAAAAAPPAAAPAAKEPEQPKPQAGIPSKAGSSAEPEDFSTLFGTLGLPNIRF